MATQTAPQQHGGLSEQQQAAKRPRTNQSSTADPTSGGSGTSAATVEAKAMPIARFDPSLVAAVKCATEILQSDDGWSKEEAAATIAVLASKFQNSKRRTTGCTSGTTGGKSGEGSQQGQQAPAQPAQQEQCEQSGSRGAAGALGGFSSLYGQQQHQHQRQQGQAGKEQPGAAAAAAAWQAPRLSSLLPGLCRPTASGGPAGADPSGAAAAAAGSAGAPDQPWPHSTAAPLAAVADGAAAYSLLPNGLAGGGFGTHTGQNPAAGAAAAEPTGTAAAAAAADSQMPWRAASLDAASGSTAGRSQPGTATDMGHVLDPAAAAAAGGPGDSKGLQLNGSGPTVSGFGSVPGSPGNAGAAAAAGGTGQYQQQQAQGEAGVPPLPAAPSGRRTLDAASAAAVAAAAKAASKIAATAAATGGFGRSPADILSDAGGNKSDQALCLASGDAAAAPGTASSPLAAVGSSSCAEPSAQRQGSGAAGDAAATSAEQANPGNAQQGMSGSLEDILAQVGAQTGGNGQLQLPLALMHLLQSGQPQALPLMSALLRSGNLRPLVADALKVRLSTYLQQQQQQQQHQGMATLAQVSGQGAAAAGAAAGSAGPAAMQDSKQESKQQPGLTVSSDSRSAGSTAAGSQASADPEPVEATRRKRGRQPANNKAAAAAAAAAAERPRKRQAKGAAAAAAAAALDAIPALDPAAAAAAAVPPVELTATGRPKRGRPAKGKAAAAAAAAAAAESAAAAAAAAAIQARPPLSATPSAHAELGAAGATGMPAGMFGDSCGDSQVALAAAAQQQGCHLQQQQQQLQQQSSSVPLGGLQALLAADDDTAVRPAAQAVQGHQQNHPAAHAMATDSPQVQQQQQLPQQRQRPLPQQQQYDTSAIADCPELLQKLQDLPPPVVHQVIDMASKLPPDMPQNWRQTVLLQTAESAMNVLRQSQQQQQQPAPQPPQQQQPQQLQQLQPAAIADSLGAAASAMPPTPSGSKTATPAPDPAAAAAAPVPIPPVVMPEQPPAGIGTAGRQPSDLLQPQAMANSEPDVLPGLLAAAQHHPQLRSMPAEKREALLKQLLQQHQARRARAGAGQQQQQVAGRQHGGSYTGSLQGNAPGPGLQDLGRAGSVSASGAGTGLGLDWGFGANPQQQQQQHASSGVVGLSGMGMMGQGGVDMPWLQGPSGPSSLGGRQQAQAGLESAHGLQNAHSGALGGLGAFQSFDQQQHGNMPDPAYSAAFGAPTPAAGAAGALGFDAFNAAASAAPNTALIGASAALGSADAGSGGVAGGSSCTGSNWDTSNFLQGLMGGVGPEKRQAYMRKLQQQLDLHGMNKKQLVELMRLKGAVTGLRSIGMVPSDISGSSGGLGGDNQLAAASTAATAAALQTPSTAAAAAAAAMDPAMAAAMPSDAAFAAMRQQHLQQQQQLSLGPHQQAWLQQQQHAAGLAGDSSMTALLAQQHQQQQWQGLMGMQAGGLSAYPNLMGPSLYGMGGMTGAEQSGAGSMGGLGGLAGMGDPLAGLLSGQQQQALLLQQQQHAMAYSSAMAGSYHQPHVSMGLLAAQQHQQLMFAQQQQQLAGLQQMGHAGQQGGLGDATAAASRGAWGAAGLGMGTGSSPAALDPPVLELPNLSPIKTGAAGGATGLFSAAAAAAGGNAAGIAGLGVAAAGGAAAAGPGQGAAAGAGTAGGGHRVIQSGTLARTAATSQQGLQTLAIPGSLGELGGGEEEGFATLPFGQLGLNAADVDALLSGFEPPGLNLLTQTDDAGGATSTGKMHDLWGNMRAS